MTFSRLILLGVVGAAFAAMPAGAQTWQSVRVTTGFDYSSGDYGGEVDTDILYVPVALTYERGAWRGRVTLPYLEIEGPGSVVGGDEPVIIGGGGEEIRKASGVGDITLALTYGIEALYDDGVFIDFTGKVKLPTADEDKGLGTGKTDYRGQIDLAFTIGDFTPFGMIGYRVLGDPEGFDLRNTLIASAGGQFRLNDTVSVGASYDYREASTALSDAPQEMFGYVNIGIADHWSVNVYGIAGLSDGSPDHGVGLQLTYRSR